MIQLSRNTKLMLPILILVAIISFLIRIKNPIDLLDNTTYSDIIYYNEFIESFPFYSKIHYWNGIQYFGVVYLPNFYFIHLIPSLIPYGIQLWVFGIVIFVLSIVSLIKVDRMYYLTNMEKIIVMGIIIYEIEKGIFYCNYETIVFAIIIHILGKKDLKQLDFFILALFQFKMLSVLLVIVLLFIRNDLKYFKYIVLYIVLLNFWYLIVIDFNFEYLLYVFDNTFDDTLGGSKILRLFTRETSFIAIFLVDLRILRHFTKKSRFLSEILN